ncbi:hypothetical protein NV379_10170 [Paenibacillus sp. N1-5-1-14]|nr:hypothetical protein [Paenibacillus radicibacter]
MQYALVILQKETFMKTKNSRNAYNENTAKQYISDEKPIISVSPEVETQYNWIDGKRTDEVTGYKLYFVQEGVNPFMVKFVNKPSLAPFLSEVRLDKLEAIEIRSNVYFRSEGVRVVK